jgi:predicted HicB family RNase H-like nuclease
MKTPDARITFRLPDDLHTRLKAAAAREHRSLNAQIVVYVERGLAADEQGEDQGG